jgi:hypothetical protein
VSHQSCRTAGCLGDRTPAYPPGILPLDSNHQRRAIATPLEPLQGFFTITSLTWDQWLAPAAVGSTVLWVEELRKALVRRRQPAGESGGRTPTLSRWSSGSAGSSQTR